MFSRFESKLLEAAISNKKDDIKNLRDLNTNCTIKLTKHQRKYWYKYFDRKLQFVKSQSHTKWKYWPIKLYLQKRNTSRKQNTNQRKHKKRVRQLQAKAKEFIDNKTVRILIHEQVPNEVIVVLGKGLGFIESPSVDIEQLRMDSRRALNTIISKSKQLESENQEDNQQEVPNTDTQQQVPNTDSIPSKHKRVNYHLNTYEVQNPGTKQAIEIVNNTLNTIDRSKIITLIKMYMLI